MNYSEKYIKFWNEFGSSKKMVLSTSLEDVVTSRMMSIVAIDGYLYFQTDNSFRKYKQLKGNNRIALCIDNIQIEGVCEEVGHPMEHNDFCTVYRNAFSGSYERYSKLRNERLFMVTPTFIERWIYLDSVPYMEIFDVANEKYNLQQYTGR